MEYSKYTFNVEFERKSNLTTQSLENILNAFKEIVNINDSDKALKETDNIIFQVIEKLQNQNLRIEKSVEDEDEEYLNILRKECDNDIDEFINEFNNFEENFLLDEDSNDYEIENMRENTKFLGSRWDKDIKKEYSVKLSEIKKDSEMRIKKLEESYFLKVPERLLLEDLYSITSVKGDKDELDKCEKYLKKNKLINSDLQNVIQKCREKLAWYRAKKKLDEAEIALGGGNTKKAMKLKGEAIVLLKQDWKLIFSNDKPPEINLEIV